MLEPNQWRTNWWCKGCNTVWFDRHKYCFFFFNQIFHLVFRDIEITNCGNKTGVHLSGDHSEIFGISIKTEFISRLHERVASIAIINEVPTQNSVLDHGSRNSR